MIVFYVYVLRTSVIREANIPYSRKMFNIQKVPNKRIKRLSIALFGIFCFYLFIQQTRPKKSLVYLSKDSKKLSDEIKFETNSIKSITEETIQQNYKSILIEKSEIINWERLAYVFYATSFENLLPAFINVKELRKLKTQAQISIICSFNYELSGSENGDSHFNKNLVSLLIEKYKVNLHKVDPISSKIDTDSTNWSDSFTKLHAFNLIQYDRVIFLDSDSIIRRRMDQLFFLPPAMLATTLNYIQHPELKLPKLMKNGVNPGENDEIPPNPFEKSLLIQDLYHNLIEEEQTFETSYFWSLYSHLQSIETAYDLYPQMQLASYVMVITPDKKLFEWIIEKVNSKSAGEFDMEIINQVWNIKDIINKNIYIRDNIVETNTEGNQWLQEKIVPSLLILPHNPYGLLSGEFRHTLLEHSAYLVSPAEFGYLNKQLPMLSLQRSLKHDQTFCTTVDDVVDFFPEIPYWDWAWRFDYDGKIIKNEEDLATEMKKGKRFYGGIIDDEYDDIDGNIISSGMGVEKNGWESQRIAQDAIYIHWSDWPLEKPWKLEFNDNKESSTSENDPNWLMLSLAEESLSLCIKQVETIFDSVKLTEELKPFRKFVTNERRFAKKTCQDSIKSWKDIYNEYFKQLSEGIKEIQSH